MRNLRQIKNRRFRAPSCLRCKVTLCRELKWRTRDKKRQWEMQKLAFRSLSRGEAANGRVQV